MILGGQYDTCPSHTYNIIRKDFFSNREQSFSFSAGRDEDKDKTQAWLKKKQSEIQAKYETDLKDHIRQVKKAQAAFIPSPGKEKPQIKSFEVVDKLAAALIGAVNVSYAYALKASREKQTDPESEKTDWTAAFAVTDGKKLPVLVLDDRDFCIQTIRVVYRRVEYADQQNPQHRKEVVKARIKGRGKIEWTDKYQKPPAGKD